MAKETNAANPMDADYNKTTNWGAMFKLAGFTLTPLALASGQSTPAAVVAGALLAGALIKQTVNTGEAPASYDKAAETEAIKHVHGTSALNRAHELKSGKGGVRNARAAAPRLIALLEAAVEEQKHSISSGTRLRTSGVDILDREKLWRAADGRTGAITDAPYAV